MVIGFILLHPLERLLHPFHYRVIILSWQVEPEQVARRVMVGIPARAEQVVIDILQRKQFQRHKL
jgi:hypothetical protein